MRVLAICAHPDDETLGCGGTLLKHAAAGDELHWLVGTQAHEPQWSAETVARKSAEVDAVASAYGVEKVYRLGLPTVRLDSIPFDEVIAKVRGVVEEARPEWVYVVHAGDVHSDHRVLHEATLAVL